MHLETMYDRTVIRRRRLELRLSVADLADRTGIGRNVAERIDQGRYEPSEDQADRLCEALAVAAEELYPLVLRVDPSWLSMTDAPEGFFPAPSKELTIPEWLQQVGQPRRLAAVGTH